MSLITGARLGPYEITGAIGAGGMGEVFRARDTKLNRDVAIKVLPAAFADDPERLARFTREAQTLASLDHPNIATIHGIEEVPAVSGSTGPGSRALVMELVEGEDLSVHIARGPIPIAEALPKLHIGSGSSICRFLDLVPGCDPWVTLRSPLDAGHDSQDDSRRGRGGRRHGDDGPDPE